MRLNHVSLVILSGLLWLGIGILLLVKGMHYVVHAGPECTVLKNLTPYLGSRDQAMVLLIAIGIFAGFVKGRFVLMKAVQKVVRRIASLQAPVKISQIYDQRYYVLMALMMSLGFLLNILQVPSDVRGTIDLAVGSALMNGAMGYFRCALTLKKDYL